MAKSLAKVRGSRVVIWSAAAVVAATLGLTGIVFAHDDRLDEADAAVQQAEVLLLAAKSGFPEGTKEARQFERHIKRAIDLLEHVKDQIGAAGDAVDGP